MKYLKLLCLAGLISCVLSMSLAQTRFVLSSDSVVQYEASDVNFSWQGRASVDRVELLLDEDSLANSSLRVVIKATEFRSGNIFRDADARRIVFQVRQYPDIIFETARIATALDSLQEGVQTLQLTGNLIMHGVTRPLTTTVTLEFQDGLLRATGGFDVLLSDFEMRRPTILGITVDDEVSVTFDIQGRLQRD